MNGAYEAITGGELRRGALRHKVNLGSPVLITAVANSGESGEQYHILEGRLLNVSVSGLALVISGDDFQGLRKLGENTVMRLLVPLPKESIELEAAPHRYHALEGSENGLILVGTQITNINGRDRIVFTEFIFECEATQQL